MQSPDRFIPSRAGTPTKESLLLDKPRAKRSEAADPFAPSPRRSLRLAEQYATINTPPPPRRQVGMIGSRVRDAQASSTTRRAASTGTVWTVGGSIVTEGVASVTNGRGGRVTSGSNAPHYAADFLKRDSPSEDEVTHGRRLAVAMNLDTSARMIDHSSPSSSGSSPRSDESGSPRVWKDGIWEKEAVVSRMCNLLSKNSVADVC